MRDAHAHQEVSIKLLLSDQLTPQPHQSLIFLIANRLINLRHYPENGQATIDNNTRYKTISWYLVRLDLEDLKLWRQSSVTIGMYEMRSGNRGYIDFSMKYYSHTP
jgi:hypothetical protein